MAQKIYHLVEHKILNITVYFRKRFYLSISRDIEENVRKNRISSNDINYSFIKFVMNMASSCKTTDYTLHFSFRNDKLIII